MSKIIPFLLLSLSFTLSGCAGIHNREISTTGQPIKDCMAFYFAGMGSSSAKEISACGGHWIIEERADRSSYQDNGPGRRRSGQSISKVAMTKYLDPGPKQREDGGTDYKTPGCPNVCYYNDKEGCYVSQCPALKVSVHGLECENDEEC